MWEFRISQMKFPISNLQMLLERNTKPEQIKKLADQQFVFWLMIRQYNRHQCSLQMFSTFLVFLTLTRQKCDYILGPVHIDVISLHAECFIKYRRMYSRLPLS